MMKRLPLILTVVLVAAVALVGCKSTPKGVIGKEDMAQLLADIHTGEGVIDLDRNNYRGDSLKKVLKQSIFVRHVVTQEQFDTSLVWYGYHVEDYVEVYDRVIEILEQRKLELAMTAENAQVAIAGDSVDVWQAAKHYLISRQTPVQFIDFLVTADEGWERGDVYTWRMKMVNNRSPLSLSLFADYSDGSTDIVATETRNEGWDIIRLVTDTARVLNRVYGLARLTPGDNEYIYLDSVALVRTRRAPWTEPHPLQHTFRPAK